MASDLTSKKTFLPVRSLLNFSPFDHPVWEIRRPVTRKEVQKALDEGRLRGLWLDHEGSREQHIERIANFVKHGWADPINIDVGIPAINYYREWLVTDGHHRLAAAIFRDDETIEVEVSGQLSYAAEIFGVDEESLALYPEP